MPKYRSKYVTKKQDRNQTIQTILLLLLAVGIVCLLVVYGMPALTKFALLLGDIKDTSSPITNSDTIPPTAPILNSLPQATSSASLSISGFAEAGSTVELYHQNVKTNETLTSSTGAFEFANTTLSDEQNSFYVIAIDDANNKSPKSSIKSTIFDNTPPEITITRPSQGQVFYGSNERTIIIEGKSDPGVDAHLNDRLVLISDDGSFSTKTQLDEGENTLVIKATDKAGNQTTTEIKVTYKP